MNKQELIRTIAERGTFRQDDVRTILDTLAETMIECAERGESVALSGIFSMDVVERAARKRYDATHNLFIDSPSRCVVVLHTGSRLKAIGKDNTQ